MRYLTPITIFAVGLALTTSGSEALQFIGAVCAFFGIVCILSLVERAFGGVNVKAS